MTIKNFKEHSLLDNFSIIQQALAFLKFNGTGLRQNEVFLKGK